MLENLVLLWLSALVLMGSPGPATVSLAAMGTAYGFRRSGSYLIGVMAGTTGVLLLIATGITAIILAEPVFVRVLSFVAAAYIFYLAWRIATAPIGAGPKASEKAPAFWPGLMVSLPNPKAFAAIGAAFAGHSIVPDSLLSDTVAKVAAIGTVVVIVNVGWLAFGTVFSRVLTHPTHGRIVNILFACLLVVSVGIALWNL